MIRKMRRWMIFLGMLAACGGSAWAQFTSLTGHCTDLQGKPIVGGIVVMHRTDEPEAYDYKVRTNKKGFYQDYALPLGVFTVSLYSAAGKRLAVQQNIQTGYTRKLNFDLRKLVHVVPSAPPPPPGGIAMPAGSAAKTAAAIKAMQERAKLLQQLNALVTQNNTLVKSKQWPQAIAALQKAISLDAKIGVLHSDLGRDYMGAGQYPEAMAEFQKAISLNPKHASYWIGLGNAQVKTGHPHQAMATFQKAAGVDPNQAKIALYNEGVKFYNQSHMNLAAAALGESLKLDPALAPAWFLDGMAQLSSATVDPKTGKMIVPPGAVHALQQYIKLAPTGPNAGVATATLQQLTGTVQVQYKKH